MDASNKAIYRAKLEARKQKQDKRIDSPLVRYNESDQPVCRVCDLVLKSESHWDAHKVSSKHHQAVNNLKANAARISQANDVKPKSSSELRKSQSEHENSMVFDKANVQPSLLPKPEPSASLPKNFFDNHEETKRTKSGAVDTKITDAIVQREMIIQKEGSEIQHDVEWIQSNNVGVESKPGNGALPEGFFDNKDADLRARGVEPVKPNVKDEYKEFEKLIQEDLQEVDNRMEEEEYDAAEMIEEAESVEQKVYKGKVETLKRKKMELKTARSAPCKRVHEFDGNKSKKEESSSDDEDDTDENFTVDWRAQHL